MISAREALQLTNDAVAREDAAPDLKEALEIIEGHIRIAAKQRRYGIHIQFPKQMSRPVMEIVLESLRQWGFQVQMYPDQFLIVSWSPMI